MIFIKLELNNIFPIIAHIPLVKGKYLFKNRKWKRAVTFRYKKNPKNLPKIRHTSVGKGCCVLIAWLWVISIWQKYFQMLANFLGHCVINQNGNNSIKHPPVIQNAVYISDVYRYKKDSVSLVSCITEGTMLQRKKNENVAIWLWLC